MKDFNCPRYGCSLHVNCGGNDLTMKENDKKVLYEGDAQVDGGAAKYFNSINSYWGFSSTGDFMDDNDYQNARFTEVVPSTNISELYSTAHISPLSLTYFRHCLENGNYTVSLHFAETLFTNDNTYSSLGKQIFDIYIQLGRISILKVWLVGL
ncbi:probable LRR receptor-like serine/threonine-protein kinase RFK1 [Camellia sinensis]|uniref:probable LRR receptor-like serine/threonine-protein kinase RFK1 n=1 Tax=Camellia sinensis TaxID=4442 RepID=UPI001036BFF2|nr:probable LRR receptor-like serine/threonine-protein kinase RFK1 [Camellia sinensis]